MSEQRPKSDLHDLKIALQVMGHDGARVLVPAFTTLIGVGTCCGLLFWSVSELQNFSPDSLALTKIETFQAAVAPAPPAPAVVADSTPPAPVGQVKKKVVKTAAKPARRIASRNREDQLMFQVDHPTGGRVVRADEFVTEYSWGQ